MVSSHLKMVPIIMGPTAVGKTDLCIELSKFLPIEIIMCDSRQVYKKMDIGTAKPEKHILQQLPHYLIDIIDVSEKYSAGSFVEDALNLIDKILGEKKIPIISGGTGLYLDALVKGLSNVPSVPEEIRKTLRDEWDKNPDILRRELKENDRKMYDKLHSNDKHRIIRALEVWRYTGKTLSEWWENHSYTQKYDFRIMIIKEERNILKNRIKKRVHKMLDMGWIEETEKLLTEYKETDYGLQTIGYKEIIRYLKGEIKKEELPDKIYVTTWRYAKRQLTWFNKYDYYSRKEIIKNLISY